MEGLNERVKRMDVVDIGLTKLSVAAGVLLVLTIWPAAMDWVHSVNAWWFLVAFVLFALRPGYRWLK